jgi:hypothetical protein
MLLIASRSSQDVTRLSVPDTQESVKKWRKFRLLSVISLRATESPSMVSDRYGMDGQFFDDDIVCVDDRHLARWSHVVFQNVNMNG